MSGKRNRKIIQSDGTVCELCNTVAEVREHRSIGAKEKARPFYFSRWYECKNPVCPRRTFFKEQYKIVNRRQLQEQVDFNTSFIRLF